MSAVPRTTRKRPRLGPRLIFAHLPTMASPPTFWGGHHLLRLLVGMGQRTGRRKGDIPQGKRRGREGRVAQAKMSPHTTVKVARAPRCGPNNVPTSRAAGGRVPACGPSSLRQPCAKCGAKSSPRTTPSGSGYRPSLLREAQQQPVLHHLLFCI